MTALDRTARFSVLALGFASLCSVASAAEWQGSNAETPSAPVTVDASDDRQGADAPRARREDHVRVGVLGGIGFPRPLAIELVTKVERTFALGLEYSALPTITISSVDTRAWALCADARLFPLRGPFFVGLRAGYQHVDASGSFAVSGVGTVSESLAVNTTFVNPRLGFLFTFEPGVTIGIDAGVQIPLATTTSNTLPAGSRERSEVSRVATSYGNKWLPTVDLLRIGFLL